MRIELHAHSTCSDGSEPPAQVAARAARRGVELFCLTDHDSARGYAATVGACAQVLRGLELSCVEEGRTVHILVYDAARDDARWAGLDAQLTAMRAARRQRVREMAERLARLGMNIDVETILANAGERTVGRPDVAQALVASGAVASTDEAFQRYLHDGGPGDVPFGKLSVAEGLDLVRNAGGRMALAHPHTLGPRARELLVKYRQHGLTGLECFYGPYNQRQRQRWLALARQLGLVVTGGSDFHGTRMPQVPEPGIDFPEPYARRLMVWLGLT